MAEHNPGYDGSSAIIVAQVSGESQWSQHLDLRFDQH